MSWQRRFTAPALEGSLPILRKAVEGFLLGQGIEPDVLGRAGLLLSELAHNAIEAAEEPGRQVIVEVSDSERGVQMDVECDANRDLEGLMAALEESSVLPSAESERGRGLWIILTLSEQLKVERAPHGHIRVSLVVPAD